MLHFSQRDMHAQFIRGAYQGDCGPWRAERLRPTADDSAGDSESRHAERLGLTADCGTRDHGLRLDNEVHVPIYIGDVAAIVNHRSNAVIPRRPDMDSLFILVTVLHNEPQSEKCFQDISYGCNQLTNIFEPAQNIPRETQLSQRVNPNINF